MTVERAVIDKQTSVLRKIWFFRKLDMSVLTKKLTDALSEKLETSSTSDCSTQLDDYCETLTKVLDELAPLKSCKLKKRMSCKWYTDEIHLTYATATEKKMSPSGGSLGWKCTEWSTTITEMKAIKPFEKQSADHKLKYGVPQGSVLVPFLFTVYSAATEAILKKHGIKYQVCWRYTNLPFLQTTCTGWSSMCYLPTTSML